MVAMVGPLPLRHLRLMQPLIEVLRLFVFVGMEGQTAAAGGSRGWKHAPSTADVTAWECIDTKAQKQ